MEQQITSFVDSSIQYHQSRQQQSLYVGQTNLSSRGMAVSSPTSLLQMMVLIEQSLNQRLEYGFKKMKMNMVNRRIKQISRFDTNISRQSQESYISITDFKPIQNQYTSVKILNYESQVEQKLKKEVKNYNLVEDNTLFLQNWMVKQKSQILLPQDYPLSDYSWKRISQYNQQALQVIRTYKFITFMKSVVKKKMSLFFNEVNRFVYSSEPISSPLTKIQTHLEDQACQISSEILKACGDKKSSKPPIYFVHKIVHRMIKSTDSFKQQIFLQVIKQLVSLKIQYFSLFCCLSATVKITSRMYLPVLNYLLQQSLVNLQDAYTKYYAYIFYHLIKNYDQPRTSSASIFQLYCFWHMKKVPIIVDLPKQKTFFIQSYSSVQQFLQQIIKFYNLDPQIEYLLFINGTLLEKGILLDQLLQPSDEKDYWEQYLQFSGFKATIVLKNMMQMKQSDKCFNIMYNYFIAQYLRGMYKLVPKEMIKIGAMILYSQNNSLNKVFVDLKRLIPIRKFNSLEPQKIKKYTHHIVKQLCKFSGSKIQARKEALKILEVSSGFMTHFFTCVASINEGEQFDIRLGFKWNKIILVEPFVGRTMKIIPYHIISQWGVTKKQICFKIDNLGELLCFSNQINVITSIFQAYLKYGKQYL